MTTIPGIGPFIAIVLVLELEDIQRFANAKRVASYVGLTPRVRGSAGRVRELRLPVYLYEMRLGRATW